MIFVRDDDVLMESSSWLDPLGRFKQVHGWITRSPKFMHVPAIVVKDTKKFPDAIAFIREQTIEGKMLPEIHGLEHIDYGQLPLNEVVEHLKICKEFIFENFHRFARKWYTPWGATQPHLHEAAQLEELQLVDCTAIMKLNGRYGVCQELREGREPLKFLEGREIFMHWWEGGQRLNRVVSAVISGKWIEE